MADAATITMKAVLLPEEIQLTLKDLTCTFSPAHSTNSKWYYKLVNVTTSSANLIAGNFLSKSTGINTGSSNDAITSGDRVNFLFIKNTATTDGSSSTDESIYFCLDGENAAHNSGDCIEVADGEAWFGRINAQVENIKAISGDASAESTGEGPVQCMVFALITDV